MNFLEALEALEELELLNEDLLTEKLWIAIKPKYINQNGKVIQNSNRYYRFLTVNDSTEQTNDVVDLLSARKGTYKQSLDPDAFNSLKIDLEETRKLLKTASIADTKNFDISNVPKQGDLKTLTLTDRALRKNAQQKLMQIKNATPELMTKLGNNKCLIHHIDGHEERTTKDNIVLVPYIAGDRNDLKIANGIHSILHTKAKPNIKTSPINYDTPLYYFDNNGVLKEGKCYIAIEL